MIYAKQPTRVELEENLNVYLMGNIKRGFIQSQYGYYFDQVFMNWIQRKCLESDIYVPTSLKLSIVLMNGWIDEAPVQPKPYTTEDYVRITEEQAKALVSEEDRKGMYTSKISFSVVQF